MLSVRGLVVVVACCVGSVLAFGGVAWAVAPEAPSVEVQSFTDGGAFLRGVLNPGAEGGEGTYEFVYAVSPSTCTGEGKGRRGLAFGFMGEEVFEELSGLRPHTQYTVCLLARNLAGEETLGLSKSFTTSFEPEALETGVADAVTSSTAMLHGVLNLNGARESEPGSYEFVYRRSSSECEGEGQESAGQIPAEGGGVKKEAVQHEVTGLSPNTQYTFCLRAWNGTGQAALGSPVTFTTLPAIPSITSESIERIGSDSATVTALIDPDGEATAYNVQYGLSSAYGLETVLANLSGEAQVVTVTLTGLQPATAYHFGFHATNHIGGEQAADMTFTTYPADTGGLPDGRVYEMVSPAYNPYDMEVYEVTSGLLATPETAFESSVDGNAVVYAGLPSTGGTGASGRNVSSEQYRATRSAGGGWNQVNISPPGGATLEKFAAFSSDLSAGVIPAEILPPFVTTNALSNPPKAYYEIIMETNFDEGLFHPLFTMLPPNRFPAMAIKENQFASQYVGASADFTHFLFEANDDLLEGSGELEEELALQTKKEGEYGRELIRLNEEVFRFVKERNEVERLRIYKEAESLEPLVDHQELYMSVGGRVSLVNVLPDGRLAAGGAVLGGLPPQEFQRTHVKADPSNAISADGSRIFWTSTITDPEHDSISPGLVYVREDGSRTVAVSAGPALYWAASADGRYAYYVEGAGANLWRFDVEGESREEIAAGEAGVQGVIGVNQTGEDGAYVYFVATGALTGEANAEGQKPQAGADNLYVSEPDPAHSGQHATRFIGTLSGEDGADWALAPSARTAEVAPGGRSIVFASQANLTGRPYPGEGSNEVYDYRTGDGRVFCVSCRPQASGGRLAPPGVGVFTRRWTTQDGDRVFFDSKAPLVAQDVNGVNDVYEWEPDGTGACTEAEGCDYLISDGLEATAFFADASASGNDVFIATRQRLAPEDQNEMTDLYDARVDGVKAVTPPQCTGTGCQGAPAAAPIFATPSTVTFSGVGNFPSPVQPVAKSKGKRSLTRTQKLQRALATCHRKPHKKSRAVCKAHAYKLYGAGSGGKRASAMRGAK